MSAHETELDAVVAASSYRTLYLKAFKPGNRDGRRWLVDRVTPARRHIPVQSALGWAERRN